MAAFVIFTREGATDMDDAESYVGVPWRKVRGIRQVDGIVNLLMEEQTAPVQVAGTFLETVSLLNAHATGMVVKQSDPFNAKVIETEVTA